MTNEQKIERFHDLAAAEVSCALCDEVMDVTYPPIWEQQPNSSFKTLSAQTTCPICEYRVTNEITVPA